MALLTATDLQYQYSWTALPPDDPRRRGVDSHFLNRNEGYEVLYFLNSLAANNNWNKATALHAEWLIRERLPGNVRGHAEVWQWLIDNWRTE